MNASRLALALALVACTRRARPAVSPSPTAHTTPTPPVTLPTALANNGIVGLGASVRLPLPFQTPSAARALPVTHRPEGTTPTAPAGLRVDAWATDLGGARWMALAPNGDVFVSDHRSGSVLIFRDDDHDGRAETRLTFARRLRLPVGMAFHPDGWLYVACTHEVRRFRYAPGQTSAQDGGERVIELPGLGYNQHWTRNIAFSPDHRKLYVTVGSETNVDPEEDPRRAAISECDPDGQHLHPYATGLRNPLGLAFHPDTGVLFTAVNERDLLGDDLVPDYLTSVRAGAFYGWPYAYFGAHEDPRRAGERPDLVASAVVPDLALGAHVAPLGLVFPVHDGLGVTRGDALIALHGSWNRSRLAGYEVVRARFANGQPTGVVEDFITGFRGETEPVWGRPAGLLELHDGSLLIADDGASIIWRVHR